MLATKAKGALGEEEAVEKEEDDDDDDATSVPSSSRNSALSLRTLRIREVMSSRVTGKARSLGQSCRPSPRPFVALPLTSLIEIVLDSEEACFTAHGCRKIWENGDSRVARDVVGEGVRESSFQGTEAYVRYHSERLLGSTTTESHPFFEQLSTSRRDRM